MDDLVTWLRAQLDDDERLARAAGEVCGCCLPVRDWHFADDENQGRIVIVDDPHPGVRRQLGRRWNRSYGDMFAARHIVRWDPDRALAEVDAKRRILGLVVPGRYEGGYGEAYLDTLRLLALPYADREGYRDEWRPEHATV